MQTQIKHTREGCKYLGEGQESWIEWAVYPPTLTDDDIEFLREEDWFPFYSGPGGPFRHRASVQRTKHLVLFTARGGLDI
jgi:hypothetical protein